MAKKNTCGIYTFTDGFEIYLNGVSGYELRNLEREHGKLIGWLPC